MFWLPLRRDNLLPTPYAGLHSIPRRGLGIVEEIANADDLRVLLTILCNLKSIEVRREGRPYCSVQVDKDQKPRVCPSRPADNPYDRAFRGRVGCQRFVGREVLVKSSGKLECLSSSDVWPTTAKGKRQKGKPHGAATLVRSDMRPHLRISWASFLPVFQEEPLELPADMDGIHILLHGQFLVDSGRRRIEWIDDDSDIRDESIRLRLDWNTQLRDTVVLPLIPRLLKDALKFDVISADDLSRLSKKLASSQWFRRHRKSICREYSLVQVLDGSYGNRSVRWDIVRRDRNIRALPSVFANRPDGVDGLFSGVDAWKSCYVVELFIDGGASLTGDDMRYAPAEIDTLFRGLLPQAFQAAHASLLRDLLSDVTQTKECRELISDHLMRGFREAVRRSDISPLADASDLSDILGHVRSDKLFAVSVELSDEGREVLRSLYSADGVETLPIPTTLLKQETQQPRRCLTENDLYLLLGTLHPFFDEEASDIALGVALELVMGHGHDIRHLGARFQETRFVLARSLDRTPIPLSFGQCLMKHNKKLLFRPGAESRLLRLVAALPDLEPLIVDAAGEHQWLRSVTRAADNRIFGEFINVAPGFGKSEDRAKLVDMLLYGVSPEDLAKEPLRKLCAGSGERIDDLWYANQLTPSLDGIVKSIIDQRKHNYFVPTCVIDILRKYGVVDRLDIRVLDCVQLGSLLINTHGLQLEQLDREVREAIVLSGIENEVLRQLPIFDLSNDEVGSATDRYWDDDSERIPDALRECVIWVRLFDNPGAQERQKGVVPVWGPKAQIDAALSQEEPHRFDSLILDAIDRSSEDDLVLLRDRLSGTAWIETTDGIAMAPSRLLDLPESVDSVARRTACEEEAPMLSDYVSIHQLPENVRTHAAFSYVTKHFAQNRLKSIDRLTGIVRNVGLKGRLGGIDEFPVEAFKELAGRSDDLGLSGGRLLAEMLAATCSAELLTKIVGSFHRVSEDYPKIAGQHLDALARLATGDDGPRQAAECAYRYGFKAVAKWTKNRGAAFGNTKVPTQGVGVGRWRSGREVVNRARGVERDYVLDENYAQVLDAEEQETHQPPMGGDHQPVGVYDTVVRDAVTQHKAFISAWRGIPGALIAMYLWFAGRHNSLMEAYRSKWLAALSKLERAELEGLVRRDPVTGLELGREHSSMDDVFAIEEVDGRTASMITMSGDRFDVLLEQDGWLVLNPRDYRIERARVITFQIPSARYFAELQDTDRVRLFRDFVEEAASVYFTRGAMVKVRGIIKRFAGLNTLADTERMLRDGLPTLLSALNISRGSSVHRALKSYNASAIRAPENDNDYLKQIKKLSPVVGPAAAKELLEASRITKLKNALWSAFSEPAAAKELLQAIRDRMAERGYSVSRVLFELWQNADDAYCELSVNLEPACFKLVYRKEGLSVAHWGRPINCRGSRADDALSRGYDQDLFKMLVVGISEKHPDYGVTGKFGLGFKCVHLLSDSVGIASGGIVAVRTVGGILPEAWPDGQERAGHLSTMDRGTATLFDVPYNYNTTANGYGDLAVHEFMRAMTWLPAFAHCIRRIEIRGDNYYDVDCREVSLCDSPSIDVVTVVTSAPDAEGDTQRALRFKLDSDYSLLVKIGASGPERLWRAVKRLWNVTPLDEEVDSGWLVNGPFAVGTGRESLVGGVEGLRAVLKDTLGAALGIKLLELYRLVTTQWAAVAGALGLNYESQQQFWSRLFDVMSGDFEDRTASCLHELDSGYGYLIRRKPVTPPCLPSPFDELVVPSEDTRYASGALTSECILVATREWRAAVSLQGSIVADCVARRLNRIGFDIRSITLAEVLEIEIGEANYCISPELAAQIGHVITPVNIDEDPLRQEKDRIGEITMRACFRAMDGMYRPVRELSVCRRDEEAAFAPNEALLDDDYDDQAIEFFDVARSHSGRPAVSKLREWVYAASDECRKRAVLLYLVDVVRGRDLAESLQSIRPQWIDEVLRRCNVHRLVSDWPDRKRKVLVAMLKREAPPLPPPSAAKTILDEVYRWWKDNRNDECKEYEARVYPLEFGRKLRGDLRKKDRKAWFTMLALASYQSLGRTRDEQHRDFIVREWGSGVWGKLAESMAHGPSEVDEEPWLECLRRWSSSEWGQHYHLWKRTLIDLYSIARGLNEYIELILRLPRFVKDYRGLSPDRILDAIRRPSYSPLVQRLGLDAPAVDVTLSVGCHWLIRELYRHGVYDTCYKDLIAPYCWAPTRRVRSLLKPLGWSGSDGKSIYEFVVGVVGDDKGRFLDDFDLPLQIVTRSKHKQRRNSWFRDAGLPEPDLGAESDSEDVT